MAAEKTKALILKVLPYRESSCILNLFTNEYGLVHGVAKGVKRKNNATPSLERGFLSELMLYHRPNREMHTIGAISLLNYYPSTRTDLYKNVIRDLAFEVLMQTMSCDAAHPEIFSYLLDFCAHLESQSASQCFPVMTWQFLFHFCRLMGVAPSLEVCAVCGNMLDNSDGAFLVTDHGCFRCASCALSPGKNNGFVPAPVMKSLQGENSETDNFQIALLPPAEIKRLIRLFTRYCQYHFHCPHDYKSLDFIESFLPAISLEARHG